jgi:hypothetical protein
MADSNLKNRLRFTVEFQCDKLHNEWNEKDWKKLQKEISTSLHEKIFVKLPTGTYEFVSLKPICVELINNKE